MFYHNLYFETWSCYLHRIPSIFLDANDKPVIAQYFSFPLGTVQ